VFDARRFNRPRQDIIEAKLKGLASMDRELRALETALDDRQELMLLHEPGITVCPRCGAIHGSDANFCSGCGLPRAGAGLPLGPRPPLPPGAAAAPASPDQTTLNLPADPGPSR
jgi:ribosomal protein L40E